MSQGLRAVESQIARSMDSLIQAPAFKNWLGKENVVKGDLVLLNNSFIYRDRVKTVKNLACLCLPCSRDGSVSSHTLSVASSPSFNVDFKHVSAQSSNTPSTNTLKDAVQHEMNQLGHLLFVLIGSIDENKVCKAVINHSLFKELSYCPVSTALVEIQGESVVISNLLDPELVWNTLQAEATNKGAVTNGLPASFESPFAQAYEQLQAEASVHLHLPSKSIKEVGHTLLGQLADLLNSQGNEYESSLNKCLASDPLDKDACNNLLRLAYNFAGDATRFIDLLISICDLKPLVLWCTIADHYTLAEAFRNLPWIKSRKKPSLTTYDETVAGARNHAFHDFFRFRHSIEVNVDGLTLKARRLRLFPPFSQRKQNQIEYEDQEIVELLTQFTRAPETAVSMSFWQRNLDVIRATENLFRKTAETLVLLRKRQTD